MAKRKSDPTAGYAEMTKLLRETVYPKDADLMMSTLSMEECFREIRVYCKELATYKVFYEHIKQHLFSDQQVVCKICGKTYQEIINEWIKSKAAGAAAGTEK